MNGAGQLIRPPAHGLAPWTRCAVEARPDAARAGLWPDASPPTWIVGARPLPRRQSLSTLIVALFRRRGCIGLNQPGEPKVPPNCVAGRCSRLKISTDCRPPVVDGAANGFADLPLKRHAPITFAPHAASIAITHALWNAVKVILVAELGPRIRIRAAGPARDARRGFRRMPLNKSARHAAAPRSSGANRPWPCRRPSAIASAALPSKHQR